MMPTCFHISYNHCCRLHESPSCRPCTACRQSPAYCTISEKRRICSLCCDYMSTCAYMGVTSTHLLEENLFQSLQALVQASVMPKRFLTGYLIGILAHGVPFLQVILRVGSCTVLSTFIKICKRRTLYSPIPLSF